MEIQKHQESLPANYQVVIHVGNEESEWTWKYYMIDHDPEVRCIFWLHEYDATDDLSEVKGMGSPSHLSKFHKIKYSSLDVWYRALHGLPVLDSL